MVNKFRKMLELQAKLNLNTNGPKWLTGTTDEGRTIDWYRCIRMESSELIDSFNWKHWKNLNAKEDIPNAKIEAVDIWHFIMGQFLTIHSDLSLDEQAILLDKIVSRSVPVFDITVVEATEELIHCTFDTINESLKVKYVIKDFITLIANLGMSFSTDIYKLYFGKNILNEFRQEHGYKDGTYIKVWFGKEDNVYVQDYINKYPDAPVEVVHAYLREQYRHVEEHVKAENPKPADDFIGRLKTELEELTEKYDKLMLFINSDNFKSLEESAREQLHTQSGVMRDYIDILEIRLKSLS